MYYGILISFFFISKLIFVTGSELATTWLKHYIRIFGNHPIDFIQYHQKQVTTHTTQKRSENKTEKMISFAFETFKTDHKSNFNVCSDQLVRTANTDHSSIMFFLCILIYKKMVVKLKSRQWRGILRWELEISKSCSRISQQLFWILEISKSWSRISQQLFWTLISNRT